MLGVGIVLVIIGAAIHGAVAATVILVLAGVAAAAWGVTQLVPRKGKSGKRPGRA